ncbi:hypothetical protein BH24ACT15_BH24ACT15_11160 [soil metagenome]|jgi:hypothetical protein
MDLMRRIGFVAHDGRPTRRAALWAPIAGSLLTSTGVALWLFK